MTCICEYLPLLDNDVRVHVLQHARERRHPLGTARLLRLGLSRVTVHPLVTHGRSGCADPVRLPPGVGLLYPSPAARRLDEIPEEQRPRQLAVLDGTWSHAHRIYRDTPWIRALPHYLVHSEQGSNYRIRREPRKECLSTVEVVVEALRVLEPALQGTASLLSAFDAMVDDQIAAALPGARPKRPRRQNKVRRAASRAIPSALMVSPDRLIVVFGDAAPGRAQWQREREAIRISAVTLDGRRCFDAIVAPTVEPDAWLSGQMGLPDGWRAQAQSPSEAHRAFRAFCHHEQLEPVVVAWSTWTHKLAREIIPEVPHVLLRGVWANVHRKKVGTAHETAEAHGLVVEPVELSGRAGARLAPLRALVEALRHRALSGSVGDSVPS